MKPRPATLADLTVIPHWLLPLIYPHPIHRAEVIREGGASASPGKGAAFMESPRSGFGINNSRSLLFNFKLKFHNGDTTTRKAIS